MLKVLSALAGMVWVAYGWSTMFKDFAKALGWDDVYEAMRRIRLETKPFRYVAVLLTYLPTALDGKLVGWNAFFFVTGMLACYVTRNDKDDDDRWKRRREKLAGKVAEVGGKLVVVPVGEPS